MAVPIIPVAAAVIGAVALARNIQVSPVDQRVEDCLDDMAEGVSIYRDPSSRQINGSTRWKRIIRFGKAGLGFEIDASAFGRIKMRKVS